MTLAVGWAIEMAGGGNRGCVAGWGKTLEDALRGAIGGGWHSRLYTGVGFGA